MFKMFALFVYAGVLTLTTDGALGLYIEPRLPDGLTVHKVIATWQEANLQCTSEGGVVASPINAQLLGDMKSLIGFNNTAYFIGTRVVQYPGPYLSVEGVPLDQMTAAVLEMVQELDPRDGDCLSMDRYSIRVVPCCSRLPYMCYKQKIEQSTTTTEEVHLETSPETVGIETFSVAPEDSSIFSIIQERATEVAQNLMKETTENIDVVVHCGQNSAGYVKHQSTGSCYKKHDESLNWDEATDACEREGAHLLVLDNEHETQVIMSMYPHTAWWIFVGLRNYGPMQGWMTTDGKSSYEVYNRWIIGTYEKSQQYACALLKFTGELDWDYCKDSEHPFVCEKNITYSSYDTNYIDFGVPVQDSSDVHIDERNDY